MNRTLMRHSVHLLVGPVTATSRTFEIGRAQIRSGEGRTDVIDGVFLFGQALAVLPVASSYQPN